MSGEILAGPFLTRSEVARRLGIPPDAVAARHDLLSVDGNWLEEVYFGFQLADGEVRRDIGRVVMAMRGRCDDATIADWLVRPNDELRSESPLRWLAHLGSVDRLLRAASNRAAAQPAAPAASIVEPVAEPRPVKRTPERKPLLHFPRHVPAH